MSTAKKQVLITPRSLSKNGHPALDALTEAGYELLMPWPGRQPAVEELKSFLPGCSGYLAGVEPIPSEVLDLCSELRIISRNGVGIDNVDLVAAKENGIAVQGTPGANSQGVAELALTHMLSSLRSVAWSSSRMKAGNWDRRKGMEVVGKTLGVIGCGQIGQRLAKMAIGIGMQVIGYDLYPAESMKDVENFRFADMETVISESDVISLHCPPGEKPLVGESFLSSCKDGVVIVNTARAGLVDDAALLAALESGKVFHYATDVFASEPPELNEMLLDDRVTMTPHIGGFTNESVQRATEAAVTNILNVLGE